MQWQDLLVAMALVLVWEGLMPTINPAAFRNLLATLQEMDDKKLRIMGLSSMILGAVLVFIIKQQ
ncbi:MAG: DUF2065 domain-containing protein [Pseudomonadota bacterium]